MEIVAGLGAIALLFALIRWIGSETRYAQIVRADSQRENFYAVHGRYPTDADYEDPIA